MFINCFHIVFICLADCSRYFNDGLVYPFKRFFVDEKLVSNRLLVSGRLVPAHNIFADFTFHNKTGRGSRLKADFYLIDSIIQRVNDDSIFSDIRFRDLVIVLINSGNAVNTNIKIGGAVVLGDP